MNRPRCPFRSASLGIGAAFATILACATAGCGAWTPSPAGALTSVGEIRGLAAPLSAPVDVRLRGTITFFNSAMDQAYVQDATGGVRVDRIGLDPLVHVGDVVELTGRATMGGPAPIALRETLRAVSYTHLTLPTKRIV